MYIVTNLNVKGSGINVKITLRKVSIMKSSVTY